MVNRRSVIGGVAAILASLSAATAAEAPRFVEQTAASGIDHRYSGPWEFFVGGGVAAFDCSGDGAPELFLPGGEGRAMLYRNDTAQDGPLRFTALPESGLSLDAVTGAYPLDIDGDGMRDLMLLRVGENVLLRGLGDCRFERANEAWGFDGGNAWSTAFSATWEPGNAWPTLAVGNYVDRAADGAPFGTCHDNALTRPNAQGDGFAPPLALTPGHCALSMLFSDWRREGRADLRVSNDRQYYRDGEEQLWRMRTEAPPRLLGRADGWNHLSIWGMGIASYDLTGDGRPEYFMTSMGDNKLRMLEVGATTPSYGDAAFDRGVTATTPFIGDSSKPSTAWHADFQDVNNDGLVDLFIAKGNVEAMPETAAEDPNNLLLGQPDGRFQEAADRAGVASIARSRGAAVLDLDLDGLLDLVVVNRGAPAQLWHNTGMDGDAPAHWLQLALEQEAGNREAIGAWVELKLGERTVSREVTVGGGHAGGQRGWLHFGLGDASAALVRVVWPDGEAGQWHELPANSFAVLTRNGARPWHAQR